MNKKLEKELKAAIAKVPLSKDLKISQQQIFDAIKPVIDKLESRIKDLDLAIDQLLLEQ